MDVLGRLARSRFRARFRLAPGDAEYARRRGRAAMADHAREILRRRVAPASPVKDGRQTPYRGHPVFIAQHATATCCRGCVEKWHGVPRGREISDTELDRLVRIVMAWLETQLRLIPSEPLGGASRSETASPPEPEEPPTLPW